MLALVAKGKTNHEIAQGLNLGEGTVRNYVGLKSRVRGQRLMLGPWYHGPFDGKAGELDFGAAAKGDTDTETLRWYDHLLRGIDNGVDREKPVKIYVMGKNVWRSEDDWPLARAHTTRYYLHSAGGANTSWSTIWFQPE